MQIWLLLILKWWIKSVRENGSEFFHAGKLFICFVVLYINCFEILFQFEYIIYLI